MKYCFFCSSVEDLKLVYKRTIYRPIDFYMCHKCVDKHAEKEAKRIFKQLYPLSGN